MKKNISLMAITLMSMVSVSQASMSKLARSTAPLGAQMAGKYRQTPSTGYLAPSFRNYLTSNYFDNLDQQINKLNEEIKFIQKDIDNNFDILTDRIYTTELDQNKKLTNLDKNKNTALALTKQYEDKLIELDNTFKDALHHNKTDEMYYPIMELRKRETDHSKALLSKDVDENLIKQRGLQFKLNMDRDAWKLNQDVIKSIDQYKQARQDIDTFLEDSSTENDYRDKNGELIEVD